MKFGCITQRIRGDISAKAKTAPACHQRERERCDQRGRLRCAAHGANGLGMNKSEVLTLSSPCNNPAGEAGRRRGLVVAKTAAARHTETPFAAD
jgi:hypothetical protein